MKINNKILRKKILKPKIQDYFQESSKTSEGTTRCSCCYGVGVVVHPDAESDPIEGHKLSPRIKCSNCKGKGVVPLENYRNILNEDIGKWKKYESARKELIKKLKTIYVKINEKDIQVIRSIIFTDKFLSTKEMVKTLRSLSDLEFFILREFVKYENNYKSNVFYLKHKIDNDCSLKSQIYSDPSKWPGNNIIEDYINGELY